MPTGFQQVLGFLSSYVRGLSSPVIYQESNIFLRWVGSFHSLLSISWEFIKFSQISIHQIPNSWQSGQIFHLHFYG